jgi:inorganic pyrophosphatase
MFQRRFISLFVAAALITGATAHARTHGFKVPTKLSRDNRAKLHKAFLQARPKAKQNPWLKVRPLVGKKFNVIVEIPKGTRKKMELDIGRGRFELDRTLPKAFRYPENYGLLPRSFYHDGDPLDVLLLGSRKATGSVVRSRVVGVLYLEDEKGLDSKLIAVPASSSIRRLKDLPAATRTRLTTFFNTYKLHEADQGKYCNVLGWGGKRQARREAKRSIRFVDQEASLR